MARLITGVVMSAGVIATLLLSGCRALRPVLQDSRTETSPRTGPSASPLNDSANSAERQRLLPLRAYMDELSQRQAAIETRLDSIGRDIAGLRRSLEEIVRHTAAVHPTTEIPKEDSIVAGSPSANAIEQDRPASFPALRSSAGVILPDNTSALHSGNGGAPTKSPHRKERVFLSTKPPTDASVSTRQDASTMQLMRRTTSSKPSADEKLLFDSAIVSLRAGRFTECTTKLSKLLEHNSPRKGEYLYWRAVAYYQMQQIDRAHSDAEAAWQLVRSSTSPRRPDVLYLLAEISAERGDRDRTLQYLQTLIESFPSSDAAILARRKLQQMAVK